MRLKERHNSATGPLSANALVDRLKIERCEADGICDVRNGLIHNRRDLSEIISEGLKKISRSNSGRIHHIGKFESSRSFMNYLYTLLGDALMEEIGYSGETQPYFTI
jgi:hypothetical protein